MTCNHKWLTPEGNRATCVHCGTDGFVSIVEIEILKKQIDDKIQEAFTTRETGPWEKLREIRKIINGE